MAMTGLTTPVRLAAAPQSLLRQTAGVALIAVGIMLVALTQWSISSLADDLALEIQVPESFRSIDHDTANAPFGSGALATTRVATSADDPVRELRTHLRSEGFTLAGAEPERWSRARTDGYDGTIWTLRPHVESDRVRHIDIEATTTDDDARIVFPVVLVIAFALMIGGTSLSAPNGTFRSWRQQGLGTSAALLGTIATTIAVRALHQANQLINTHVAEHGPLPEQLFGFGYDGNESEILLAEQLCVVAGLYPFGVLAALAPLVLGALGLLRLVWSRRGIVTVIALTAIAVVTLIWLYGSTSYMVVDILE